MSDQNNVISLLPRPGIQRDGTSLDSNQYVDGQWVRFQRGKPKKMGGYFRITDRLRGPINSSYIFSEDGLHYLTVFGPTSIEGVSVDDAGLGGAITDRTPSAYTPDDRTRWSVDSMYDAAYGSGASLILAVPVDPNSSAERSLYISDASSLDKFVPVSDVNAVASGGVFAAPPYAVLYGTDGKVTWSNQNEPQNFTTGDAGTARVTGSKIVQGFSMRTGGGLGGLLWSLDSVIRMDYIGGQAVFRFQKLSQSASILTQNTVIEYDGVYYWIGNDRFLISNGSQVNEMPNDTNLNWFFDNLNFAQRHKVWGTKIPRYGEIWWFFPFGDNTECSHAVIYNIREKCWYDVELPRSAGYHSQTLPFPMMAGAVPDDLYAVRVYGTTGTVNIGDKLVGDNTNDVMTVTQIIGVSTGALTYSITGVNCVVTESPNTRDIGDTVYITSLTGGLVSNSYTITNRDASTWTITTGSAGAGTLKAHDEVVYAKPLINNIPVNEPYTGTSGTGYIGAITETYSLYGHERGHDSVIGDHTLAIPSFFTTVDFGLPTGGLNPDKPDGANRWTRVTRIEPDFVQSGDMTVEVLGREFANSEYTTEGPHTFSPSTEKIDIRTQARHIQMKFTSNEAGGHYEMGRPLLHIEMGDRRT